MKRAWLTILALSLAACGSEQPAQREGVELRPQVKDPSQVVARVNDAPITIQELQRQMSGGASRDEALQQLIQMELLAQEATRRGLHQSSDVAARQRRAMANRLIRREFGDRFTRASIPDDLMEFTYKQQQRYFVHPEQVHVWHFLVHAHKRRIPKKDQQRATKICQQFRELATRKPLTLQQFKDLKKQIPVPAGPIKLDMQDIVTALKGDTVADFAQAAFALQNRGDVSPVVETRFGCHVLYLVERRPAKNVTLRQADKEIRNKIFVKARQEVFKRWVAKIEKGYQISVHPKVLEAAHRKKAAPAGKK